MLKHWPPTMQPASACWSERQSQAERDRLREEDAAVGSLRRAEVRDANDAPRAAGNVAFISSFSSQKLRNVANAPTSSGSDECQCALCALGARVAPELWPMGMLPWRSPAPRTCPSLVTSNQPDEVIMFGGGGTVFQSSSYAHFIFSNFFFDFSYCSLEKRRLDSNVQRYVQI